MNLSVHLDDETVAALDEVAHASEKSRNALIELAVMELLDRHHRREWPRVVTEFFATQGSDEVAFESHRRELVAPPEWQL